MSIVKTFGIVTRYTNYREYDRIITLFSREHGKIQASARGCRKPKSKLMAASQLFCYGEYVLYQKQGRYSVSQCEIHDSFYNLRNDLEVLAHATYLLNLCDEAVNPGDGNPRLFHLLLNALTFLNYSEMNPVDVSLIFHIQFMDLLGYRPELSRCVECGRDIIDSFLFGPVEGGLLCSHCNNQAYPAYTIQRGTLQTMKYILQMDSGKMNTLKLSNEIREQLKRIISPFMESRLEKRFRSKEFLKQLDHFYQMEG